MPSGERPWASENTSNSIYACFEDVGEQNVTTKVAEHPVMLSETTRAVEAVTEIGKHLAVETLDGDATGAAVATNTGLAATPLPQSPHHLNQRTPQKPPPPLEPSTCDPKLVAGKACLRRCNAKFQALLERKQRGL